MNDIEYEKFLESEYGDLSPAMQKVLDNIMLKFALKSNHVMLISTPQGKNNFFWDHYNDRP